MVTPNDPTEVVKEAEVAEEVENQIPSCPLLPMNPIKTLAPAGHLSRYIVNWRRITNNSFIIRLLEEGYKFQLNHPIIFHDPIISNPKNPILKEALSNEIEKHVKNNVVSLVPVSEEHLVSRVFVVKKNSGGFRMVLDLSYFNKFVNKVHFRMENLSTIKELLSPNDFMVSLDLKDAFFSIPIHYESKKFTCFEFNGARYNFNCLPFGFSASPRIFSKVLKVAISHLRSCGIKISFYLDDIFLCHSDWNALKANLDYSIEFLTNLGFIINYKKSNLIPSKQLLHLGFVLDTSLMCISLPLEKVEKIRRFANFLLIGNCSVRDLASFIGIIVSSREGFTFAPLFYRRLQFFLISCLSQTHCNWDQIISLNKDSLSEVLWWSKFSSIIALPVSLRFGTIDITLTCDASNWGWGAFLSSGESISGKWSVAEAECHINFLELKAVLYAIREFLPQLRGKNLKIFSDNSTTVQYLKKMGGTHSKSLCFLTIEIWKLLMENKTKILVSHISGKNNIKADFLSRFSHLHEYSLSNSAFEQLISMIPFNLDTDWFASSTNSKLPCFAALSNENEASYTDAFSHVWGDNGYFFPPIPLIAKVVNKLVTDRVNNALVITPAWISLPMLPILKNSLCSNPIFISSSYLEGRLPTRHAFSLMAWPFSNALALKKVYQKKQVKACSRVWPKEHSHLTWECGASLVASLKKMGIEVLWISP